MRGTITAAALAALLVAGPAAAVYKCQVNGETVFSQTPCAPDAEEVRIRSTPPSAGGGGGLTDGDLAMLQQAEFRNLAERRRVAVGMTPDWVRRAWGSPTTINRSVHSSVVTEQWVYRSGLARTQYVHFRDGVVSSISD